MISEYVEISNADGTIKKLRVSDLDQEKLKVVKFYARYMNNKYWETEGNYWLYIGDENERKSSRKM